PADGGGGGGALDRAAVGSLDAGEDPQERGLPDAVGADDTDAGASANSERHLVEHDLGAMVARDVAGDQHDDRPYRGAGGTPSRIVRVARAAQRGAAPTVGSPLVSKPDATPGPPLSAPTGRPGDPDWYTRRFELAVYVVAGVSYIV